MSVVDDILTMDSAESRCSINGDTRDIVVPDEYHIFGVESDENVTRIPFICPKIVGDNVDLTGYSLYINYINGAGLGGIYVIDDVVTSGDNITFSWLLSRNVTAKAGTVSYIICAKKSGTDAKVTNEWNTKIATGTVSSGIETYDTVVQQSSDVINKLLKLTQGQSAYDIAIDNGFVGTKAAWLESLKGAEGAPVNWRGVWGEDTEYSKLDAVSYDGSSYIFTSDTHAVGSIPGIDGEWGLMTQKGNDGANGVTPHIGDNGNWYLGTTDTGKPSRGAKGDPGKNGNDASVTEANITSALGYKPAAPTIIDTAMSDTSTNPVQNKVIKAALDGKSGTAVATASANGLMSAADKKKLDGVTAGANKTVVDATLNDTSANPVQGKIIKKYIDDKVAEYVNADYQARFDGKFLQIAYSYVAGGGATNSKEHYEHCAKNDYDAVKADLRLTSDNQLVCCHDAGITLNADGRIVSYDSSNSTAIHEMTKAQFMALEFNSMYNGVRCHTCDLETFLKICKNAGKIAYITIRGEYVDATVAAMVAAVQDASMVSRTIINSFTMDSLTAVRAAEPDLYLSLVIDPFIESERTTALTYAQGKKTCQICLYYNSNSSHTLAEMAANSTITAWIGSCIAAGIRLIGAQADAAADTSTLLKLGCCGVQTRVSRLTNASYGGLDISTLNVATTSTDDATTLTFSDAKGNQKTADIPKLQPTDAQVQAGVASWMNTNAKPTVVWSKNLYNPDAAVDGYIANNGNINGSADYWATGFIPVSPGDVLTISKAGARQNCYYRAAYTSNKTFISRESGNANTYTVPGSAAYVRLSFKNSGASKTDKVMVCANNEDLAYEAYGSHTEGGLGEYLVLMSANGKKWTLKVSDTGELSTQEIT